MATLKYHWKAIEDDDSEMDQYVDDEETNAFSDVQAIASTLKEFRIYEQGETTPKVYSVDLDNYKFWSGTEATPHTTDLTLGGISGTGKATLIYKRRNQIRLDENGNVVDPARTTYIFGFRIGSKSYTMDIRAKVGVLAEQKIDPRETSEMPI